VMRMEEPSLQKRCTQHGKKKGTTVYSLQREIRLCFEAKFFFLWLQKLY
jgi:hypothetical protein